MLLLAAMVNCRVPLSAAAWVNKLFVPVYIRHGEFLISFGLLSKARTSTQKPEATTSSPSMHWPAPSITKREGFW
jgi:hypothetical protein